MSFVYPSLLTALIVVAIPIVVHLFNFRRFKTVYFSDIRFLKQIKIEKQSQNRIKHLVVLFFRIMALCCLVTAFALPFFQDENINQNGGQKRISIFVDNSFSMEQVDENGTLFEGAVLRANDVLNAYSPADKFQILSADFQGKQQQLLNKNDAQKELNELKISPSSQNLEKILNRQNQALTDGGSTLKDIYLISDFQNHMLDDKLSGLDSHARVFLVPLRANPTSNIYIDSCWFSAPVNQAGSEAELQIRLVNNSPENREAIPVKLILNGVQKALASLSVAAGQSSISSLKFKIEKPGFHQATLKISDFPVVYDDAFYFSFLVPPKIKVLCLYDGSEPKAISALFKSDPVFAFQSQDIGKIKYDELKNNDLLILTQLNELSSGFIQEISSFSKSGHCVLLIPGNSIDFASYNNLFSDLDLPSFLSGDSSLTKIKRIEYQSPLFKNVFTSRDANVDLPLVKFHYNTNSDGSAESLLELANGSDFLWKASKSGFYVLGSPLGDKAGNFSKHALFVPTLYNIGLNSIVQKGLYQEISENNCFDFNRLDIQTETSIKITDFKKIEFIPEQKSEDAKLRISLHGQISQAGNYWVTNGKDTLGIFSLNYSRKESDLRFADESGLRKWMNSAGLRRFEIFNPNSRNLTNSITEISQGSKLWKLFLLAALGFLILEILALRFWKT